LFFSLIREKNNEKFNQSIIKVLLRCTKSSATIKSARSGMIFILTIRISRTSSTAVYTAATTRRTIITTSSRTIITRTIITTTASSRTIRGGIVR
jgi:hypothetical protein